MYFFGDLFNGKVREEKTRVQEIIYWDNQATNCPKTNYFGGFLMNYSRICPLFSFG